MNIYYYNGTLWKDVTALDSSFCEETIDRFNRISLDFVLPSEERVPELCHVTWRGEEYTLYTAPKVVKVSTREYRYTIILEGRYKELERVLVKDKLGRTKFVFTGRADQYADLISGCIDGWSTGTCTTGDRSQVIAFSNNSLLDACRMVASKFETEVQLDGGKIAFGRVERYKGDPLTLAYRQGLQKEITTEPDSKEIAVGRVYVMGGNQNIDPAKYGSRTLHLPKGGSLSVEGHTFRVDAAGRYISLNGDTRLNTSERALDATTIYPKRVGTISKVEQKGDEWDVIDETNPVDYSQHRVGGDVMRLEFQSGRLAGRSFDLTTKDDKLTGYVHAEKRFRLVRREIDGVLMPEPGTFFPSVGDKYAIFGCSLPDEYVASAEAEMLSIGARYMAERLEARVQYRAELDGLWAKKNWSTVAHKLNIGTIVRLEGAANDVRISSVRTSLNSPYTPRITFSNAPYMVGSLTTQIATIESAEVRTREETRQVFLHLQARTYEDTKVVREMIERLSLEGFTQAIKPETLQSMYAVIGSPALQFDFVQAGGAVPFSWSEGKGGTITIPGQRIQRKASGTTLEPGDKTTVTDIPALTYTLKAQQQQAYVYIELSPAPHFVISTKPLAISPDRLLVGLLNGEEGKRAFTPLYGFTEITPGQLKTDLIRSLDGKSYWDLLSGKFATKGDLLIGDPKGDTCLAYIDGVLYVKGLMVNVGSSSTTIEDALREQESKLKAEAEARTKADEDTKANVTREMEGMAQALFNELHQGVDAVNQRTAELQYYVDGAYKDGIITEVESKTIATYINEVEAMWSSAFGAYERVYTNKLLTGTPKTALGDAKITLAGAKDNLINQIKTAISDGKATKAEATETERLYNVYKTALKDFQKALKEAEDFIRSEGAGGKFLGEAVDLGDGGYVKLYNKLSGQYAKAGDTVKMVTDGSYADTTWEKGKIYILGIKYFNYDNVLVWEQLTGRDGKDGAPGKDGVGADYSKEIKELQDGLASANTAIDTLNNCRQMLKNKKITLDKLPDSLRWIYEAFANGKTEIKGGLILSKYIGLSNSSDKVTSYLSGQDGAGAHMLAAGVSGLGDTNAVSFINYDGTAKFGGIKINRDSIYIDADDSGSGVHQVVHDRLYITRSGIFAYLDRYISGGIGEGIFKANYEQGFHSKRVSIGDGGTSIIQAPRGNTMGLQIQGNLHVFGDKLEYNDQRILYENKPRTHYMTSDGGNVYLTKDDSLVLIGNEALSSAHCTITLPDASTVKVGWRCKVTTIGAVVKGSITVKTNYSSQKMFFGSDRQVSYTRDYTEKTNVLVIIRIPEQSTNNGTAYWFIKEIKAW